MKNKGLIVVVLVVFVVGLFLLYRFRTTRVTVGRLRESREVQERLGWLEEAPDEGAKTTPEAEVTPVEEPSEAGPQTDESAEITPSGKMEGASQLEAHMKTSKGLIVLELFPDKAPVTVANFVNLATRGFYDGLTFHRVIAKFMIQGGDPAGTGRGGPGYRFEDEFDPSLRFDRSGLLAMANAGPGTNGSQFFITHVATPRLNDRHTIFGRVLQGQDVVNAVQRGDTIEKLEIKGDYSKLFEELKDRIAEWNKALD